MVVPWLSPSFSGKLLSFRLPQRLRKPSGSRSSIEMARNLVVAIVVVAVVVANFANAQIDIEDLSQADLDALIQSIDSGRLGDYEPYDYNDELELMEPEPQALKPTLLDLPTKHQPESLKYGNPLKVESLSASQAKTGGRVGNGGNVLPAYCDPPNPCPLGYTAKDGCIESFENSSEFSRRYQAGQKCLCDQEHMFNCPDDNDNLLGGELGVEGITNPFLDGSKLPIAAKKGGISLF